MTTIASLLPKLRDIDMDLRYMALHDLYQLLSTLTAPLDDATSQRTSDALLQALLDPNGQVQNQAIQCLSPYSPLLSSAQLLRLLQGLFTTLFHKNNETLADLGCTALKLCLPACLPDSWCPLILENKQYFKGTERWIDLLEMVGEGLKRKGKWQPLHRQQILMLAMEQLQHPRSLVRKKAVQVISIWAKDATLSAIEQLLEQTLTSLKDDVVSERLETQLNVLIALLCSSAQRFSVTRLDEILTRLFPLLESLCDADEEIKQQECVELALQCLEWVYSCKNNALLERYLARSLPLIQRLIAYDPNYVEMDEDDEMELDNDEDDESFSDEEDDSWKIRKACLKWLAMWTCSNAELISLILKRVAVERQEFVQKELFNVLEVWLSTSRKSFTANILDTIANTFLSCLSQRRSFTLHRAKVWTLFALLVEKYSITPVAEDRLFPLLERGLVSEKQEALFFTKNWIATRTVRHYSLLLAILLKETGPKVFPVWIQLVPLVSNEDALKIMNKLLDQEGWQSLSAFMQQINTSFIEQFHSQIGAHWHALIPVLIQNASNDAMAVLISFVNRGFKLSNEQVALILPVLLRSESFVSLKLLHSLLQHHDLTGAKNDIISFLKTALSRPSGENSNESVCLCLKCLSLLNEYSIDVIESTALVQPQSVIEYIQQGLGKKSWEWQQIWQHFESRPEWDSFTCLWMAHCAGSSEVDQWLTRLSSVIEKEMTSAVLDSVEERYLILSLKSLSEWISLNKEMTFEELRIQLEKLPMNLIYFMKWHHAMISGAAAQCLGNWSVSCWSTTDAMMTLLNEHFSTLSKELLISLKIHLTQINPKVKSDVVSFIPRLASVTDETAYRYSSECFALLLEYDSSIANSCLTDQNAKIRRFVMDALRYMSVTLNAASWMLSLLVQGLKDPDPLVRHSSMTSCHALLLKSCCFQGMSLDLSILVEALIPLMVVNPSLLETIPMGPFQHVVDHGLDTRKAVYDCLLQLEISQLNDDLVKSIVQHAMKALSKEHDDIRTQSCHLLAHFIPRLAYPQPLEELITLIDTILSKRINQEKAVGQELEREKEFHERLVKCLLGGLKEREEVMEHALILKWISK